MKKILLSCVTCLLALGLVTACNNDEEVENNDGTTQDTGTSGGSDTGSGSGGGTTQGGGTTETVTLSNYTLAISFIDEDGTVTPLEGVDLYISGDWNSWGFDICTLGDDGVYTLTIASIEVGSYEYKGVTVATGETPASDWSNVEEVITGTYGANGNALLTVADSDGDNYTHKITVSITGGVIEEPFDPEDYTFTYKISIVYGEDKTPLEAAPAGVVLYAAGTFNISSGDTWADPIRLYDNGDGTYYLGLDFVPTSGTSLNIYADDTSDSTHDMWDYILGSHEIASDEVSSAVDHAVVSISVTTEYVGWAVEGGVFPPLGEDVEFYVVFVDVSTTTVSSLTGTYTITSTIDCWTDGTCTPTSTSATNSHIAFYSEAAKAPANSVGTFTLSTEYSSATHTMYSPSVTVPHNTEGTPVLVLGSWFDGWLADTQWPNWDVKDENVSWQYMSSGTIAEFVAAL